MERLSKISECRAIVIYSLDNTTQAKFYLYDTK